MGRDDPAAHFAHSLGDTGESRGQGGDSVAGLVRTPIRAVRVQEIVLHVDEDEGGGRGINRGHGGAHTTGQAPPSTLIEVPVI